MCVSRWDIKNDSWYLDTDRCCLDAVLGYPDARTLWTVVGALVIALTCIWPILQLRERSLRSESSQPVDIGSARVDLIEPPACAAVAQTPPSAASSSLMSLILRPFAGPPTRRILAWYAVVSVISTITFSLLWEARHTEVELGLFKSTV